MRNRQIFVTVNDSAFFAPAPPIHGVYRRESLEGVGEPLQKVIWSGDDKRLRLRSAFEMEICRGKIIGLSMDNREEGTNSV